MSNTVEIKNNQPRVYTANGVTLQPGLNRMDEESAKLFLSHPHIAIKVKRELITLGKGANLAATTKKEDGKAKKEPTKFDDLPYNVDGKNAGDSIETIGMIEDEEYLAHLAETETRATVKAAAVKRIEVLGEDDSEDENGDNEDENEDDSENTDENGGE